MNRPVKRQSYITMIDSSNDISNDLNKAIAEEQFFLCYQPIIDTISENMVWMEALIRWAHPVKGLINPLDFIPSAEKTGLILPIGEWVLDSACKQLKSWSLRNTSDYGISVNVSAIQLWQPGFSDYVRETLHKYNLRPDHLGIEISESILLEMSPSVTNNLIRLREQGIKIALDDFGTGYNSLKYIQEFLIDVIKIDKIFIQNMKTDISKAIIDTVISLGHRINAEVTAEGVETYEQYEYLKNQGCDRIQGYYFSKPLLPGEVSNYRKPVR